MRMMKPFLPITAGIIAACLALAPGAAANIVQLGQTSTPIGVPQCPKGTSASTCRIVLERTTALQSTSDGVKNPTVVKKNGWIVSFSVGLSNLSPKASTERSLLHTLDSSYGGTPQVAITVLKPGPKHKYTVAAESPMFHVIPFLGSVLNEPLSLPPDFTQFIALPVKAGDVIGLTTPTWLPVLAYNLSSSKFSYVQSRKANCKNVAAGQTAQLAVGASAQYMCSYTGTRVEYTATEVVNTPYPKKYVH
jgi:hypothetical protein